MTIEEAAKHLAEMYQSAPPGEKVVMIHLFGSRHAHAIKTLNPKEIAVRAGIQESYGTEIRKGINLSKYVKPR